MNTFRNFAISMTGVFFSLIVQATAWPTTGRSGAARGRTAFPARRACWPSGRKKDRRTLAGAAGQRIFRRLRRGRSGLHALWLRPKANSPRPSAWPTARPLWKTRLSDLLKNDSYGDGPRATPAVDSGRVYALSGKGALRCLDAADGHAVWGCDLLEKFGGKPPEYGFSASPVVMGDMLVVVRRAPASGKSLVAFDKTSGKVLWTALDDKIGYSTPREVTIDGVSQIIVLMGEALVSVSPKDGKEYWRQTWKTELDANVATPVISGNRLFISTRLQHRLRAVRAFGQGRQAGGREALGQQGDEELFFHLGAGRRLSLRVQQHAS